MSSELTFSPYNVRKISIHKLRISLIIVIDDSFGIISHTVYQPLSNFQPNKIAKEFFIEKLKISRDKSDNIRVTTSQLNSL